MFVTVVHFRRFHYLTSFSDLSFLYNIVILHFRIHFTPPSSICTTFPKPFVSSFYLSYFHYRHFFVFFFQRYVLSTVFHLRSARTYRLLRQCLVYKHSTIFLTTHNTINCLSETFSTIKTSHSSVTRSFLPPFSGQFTRLFRSCAVCLPSRA